MCVCVCVYIIRLYLTHSSKSTMDHIYKINILSNGNSITESHHDKLLQFQFNCQNMENAPSILKFEAPQLPQDICNIFNGNSTMESHHDRMSSLQLLENRKWSVI